MSNVVTPDFGQNDPKAAKAAKDLMAEKVRQEELRARMIDKAMQILSPAEQTGDKVVEEAAKLINFVKGE